jgi:hypothetical protein
MAQAMCAPFWWSAGPQGHAEILGNGTICFVNTGGAHIGVTADHVFAEYLSARNTHADVECQFGENTFVPENYLIDRSPDTELDLATFRVPEVFVTASGNHYHHNALAWPPPTPRDAEVVLYGGYPQVLRSPDGGQVHFGFEYFISRISSTDTTRVVLAPDLANLYWPGHDGEAINVHWGGISGGPVYRVIDASPEGEPVDRLELVGFVYQRWQEVMLARPARLVSVDGTINRNAIVTTPPNHALEPTLLGDVS